MSDRLGDRLEAARAEVKRLEQMALTATCEEVGHDWKHIGGANCGCGQCSVPVHTCTRCGDCDYGDNAEAAETRANCRMLDLDGGRQ